MNPALLLRGMSVSVAFRRIIKVEFGMTRPFSTYEMVSGIFPNLLQAKLLIDNDVAGVADVLRGLLQVKLLINNDVADVAGFQRAMQFVAKGLLG